ncbi:hypothetical protein SCHPADRAFT_566227 [Schizopora paradoxa]|uniref:Uncharacterized protein n=1 Tax=Schizopora paradoxa TaxID=27342 RepID=A0A0H2RC63_9AGAM|nr:hypothetical protein SCHPADRAFT_566227 [Schizopora paradoxa]
MALSSLAALSKRRASSSCAVVAQEATTTSTTTKRPRAHAAPSPVLLHPPPNPTATTSVPTKRRRILQASSIIASTSTTTFGANEGRNNNNKQLPDEPHIPQTRSRRKSTRLVAQSGAAGGDDVHEVDDALSHSASGPSTRRSSTRLAHTATEDDDESAVSRKRKRRIPFVPNIARGAESAVNATVALTRRLLRVPTAEGSSRHSARLDNKREVLCIEKSCASLSLSRTITVDDDVAEEFGERKQSALTSRNKRRKTSSVKSSHSGLLDFPSKSSIPNDTRYTINFPVNLDQASGIAVDDAGSEKGSTVAPASKRRKTSSVKRKSSSTRLSIDVPPQPKDSDLQYSSASPHPRDDIHRVSVEADSDTSEDTLVNVIVHGHLDDGSGKEISVEFHEESCEAQDIVVVDVLPSPSPTDSMPTPPTPPPISPTLPKIPESPDLTYLVVNHPKYSDYIPPSTHFLETTSCDDIPRIKTELRPSVSKSLQNLASTTNVPAVVVSLVPDHVPYWCKKTRDAQPFTSSFCGALTFFPGDVQDRVFNGFEGGDQKDHSSRASYNGQAEGNYVQRATLYFVAVGLGNSLVRKQHAALLRWESERAGAVQGVVMGNGLAVLASKTLPFQRLKDREWREARASYYASQSLLLGGNTTQIGDIAAHDNNNVNGAIPADVTVSKLVPPQERFEDVQMLTSSTSDAAATSKDWISDVPLEDSLSTAFNDDPIFLTAPPITVPSSPGAFPVISTIASSSKTIFLDAPPGEFEPVVETYVQLEDDDDFDSFSSGYMNSTPAHWQRSSSSLRREKSVRLRRTVSRRLWHHVKYQDPTASYPPNHLQYYNPELRYQQRRRQRGAPPYFPSKLRVSYVVADSDEEAEGIMTSDNKMKLDTVACSSSSSLLGELPSPTTPLSPLASLLTSPPSPTLTLNNGNLDALDGFPSHGSEKGKSPIEPGEILLEDGIMVASSSERREKVACAAVERVFPLQHASKRSIMQRKSELPVWKTAVFSRMGDMCSAFGTENVQARIDYEAHLMSSYSELPYKSISDLFDDQSSVYSSPSTTPSPSTEQNFTENDLPSLMVEANSQVGEAAVSDCTAQAPETSLPNECTFDEDMMSDADGDFEIDEEYEGSVSFVCSEADIEMDFETGSYSEGTSDSSEDFDSDGPIDEMREYEFKVDIECGVRQINSAGAADGMELEFTLPDYSATSPSDASSPTPSPTPSPTASSFSPCDSSSTSLENHLQLDASSDSLLDFPTPNSFAIDSFRRPFSPFVLSRFPAHCLRDSMQPVLGLGTPDNGTGREAWGRMVAMSSPMQTPPSTPTSMFDSMANQVMQARVTDATMRTTTLDASSGLLGIFEYGVDINANLGYSGSTPSSFESAMTGSSESVIGGI